MSIELEVGGLGPEGLLAEVEAVVGPEDDNGLFTQPEPVELGKDLPELGIEIGDGREVAMSQLHHGLLFELSLISRAEDLAAVVPGDPWSILWPLGVWRTRKL